MGGMEGQCGYRWGKRKVVLSWPHGVGVWFSLHCPANVHVDDIEAFLPQHKPKKIVLLNFCSKEEKNGSKPAKKDMVNLLLDLFLPVSIICFI